MVKHFWVVQLLLVQLCFSASLQLQNATSLATDFMQKFNLQKSVVMQVENIDSLESCYLIEFSQPAFILMDKKSGRILGYSPNHSLDKHHLPPALQEILQLRQLDNQSSLQKTLQTANFAGDGNTVGPFLTTSWGQNSPYNAYCPQQVPAGCVAVAMAQIMNFYEWPKRGCGEHDYQTFTYGFPVSANFNQFYQWEKFPSKLSTGATEEQYADLADFLLDVGASIEMDYNAAGSAASPVDVVFALKNYFAYSDDVKLRAIWDADIAGNDALWVEAMRKELQQGRPILYCAESSFNSSAHAYVVDGYKNEFFHVNWGWDGASNSYFVYNNFLQYNRNPNFVGNIIPKTSHAFFTVNQQDGYAPLTVRFHNESFVREGNIDAYLWDFGDGTTSTLENPQHTFTKPGAFDIKLIAFNDAGNDTLIIHDYINTVSSRTLAFVSPTGSDELGDGSAELPFASIQHAIHTSNHGDTVLVANGEYFENIDFHGKQIRVTSPFIFSKNRHDIQNTIINAQSNGSVVRFENGEDSLSVLQGFTLKNGSGAEIVPNWLFTDQVRACGGAVMCRNESAPSLKSLNICNNTATYGAAIYCEDKAAPRLVDSHIFHNGFENGGNPQQILFYYYSNAFIKDCFYYKNLTNGESDFTLMDNASADFINSIFVFADNNGMYSCDMSEASFARFLHCTVWGDNERYFYNHTSQLEIDNSIFWNFPKPGLRFHTTGVPRCTVSFSDMQYGEEFVGSTLYGKISWLQGNMDTNPMFLDPHNLDFSLMISSPCKQAADPEELTFTDMGANLDYEFLSVLPVELAGFFARQQDKEIVLAWQTHSETNNLGFEIERRTAHTEFESIGFVRGNGTIATPVDYEFIDKQPLAAICFYRLKQIDTNGDFHYSEEIEFANAVTSFLLAQNFPNPFNGSTTIAFELPIDMNVTLTIYNLKGQVVDIIVDKKFQAGLHSVQWNATDRFGYPAASGLYFYEMQAGNFQHTGRMFLVR